MCDRSGGEGAVDTVEVPGLPAGGQGVSLGAVRWEPEETRSTPHPPEVKLDKSVNV
jgi:hypothetical protein